MRKTFKTIWQRELEPSTWGEHVFLRVRNLTTDVSLSACLDPKMARQIGLALLERADEAERNKG